MEGSDPKTAIDEDKAESPKKTISKPSKMRNVCFTLNNYTETQFEAIKQIAHKYMVIGKEVGASGTPHLQGYIEFASGRSFNAIRNDLFNAHIEARKGKPLQAAVYCKKENNFYENGKLSHQGSSSVFHDIRDDLESGAELKEIAMEYPEELIKHPAGIRLMAELLAEPPPPRTPDIVLEPWEQDIIDFFERPAPHRKIYWVYDLIGAHGKSTFLNYVCKTYDKRALGIMNGKTGDLAMMWNGENIVLIDFPRTTVERVNYEIIEAIKNGRVVSPKYMSRTKFYDYPHVVCFANFLPDVTSMSADRWHIVDISDEPLPPKLEEFIPHHAGRIRKVKPQQKPKTTDNDGDSIKPVAAGAADATQ